MEVWRTGTAKPGDVIRLPEMILIPRDGKNKKPNDKFFILPLDTPEAVVKQTQREARREAKPKDSSRLGCI